MTEKLKWKNTGGVFVTADGRKIKTGEVFEAPESEIPKCWRDIIIPASTAPPPVEFGHRSFPAGENLDYDNLLERRVRLSPILSICKDIMNPIPWTMVSKRGLEGLEAEWREKLAREGDLLNNIDQQLPHLQQQARRVGNPEPSVLPPEYERERVRCLVRRDVLLEELDVILTKLSEFEQKETEAQLLPFGPWGSHRGDARYSMVEGRRVEVSIPIVEIDGQKVSENGNGPYISDDRSPYFNMSVKDYRSMIVKPWRKNRRHMKRVKFEDLPPRPEGM